MTDEEFKARKEENIFENSDISIFQLPVMRKIDGRKIKTINDVQLLFSAMALGVDDTNEYYKQIEHLLEDNQGDTK